MRGLTLAFCAAGMVAATGLVPLGHFPGDGFLFDSAIGARYWLSPAPPPTAPSVAIVALDAKSLSSKRLEAVPRALMAPVWAQLLDALFKAGARSVAFDLLFAYDGSSFRPGYDTPFLRALSTQRERVVLARSAGSLPHPSFIAALSFDQRSLGVADLVPDSDGVVRRLRVDYVDGQGAPVRSLVGGALAQAGVSDVPTEILIAPQESLQKLPTYSLVDVLACADAAPEVLREAFGNRMVFVGGTLRDEDRKTASDRYLPVPAEHGPQVGACGLRQEAPSAPQSETLPGVFVHAAAAEAVAAGDPTHMASRILFGGVGVLAAVCGVGLGFLATPWSGAFLTGVALSLLWLLEVVGLLGGVWLPMALPMVGLAASGVSANAVRYLLEERRRRRVQHAFGHYLSPFVVDRLAEAEIDLKLGGELHDVTILFADLTGFTAASQQMDAQSLVVLTNRYLELVVAEVEATGGYVDKFIGDAVMAMWGAPVPADDHQQRGTQAALAAAQAVMQEKLEAEARGAFGFGIKIGMHSGPASVGNVGTPKRYNYTAVGSTVNVASRMEGLPGVYRCAIVLSEETAVRAAERFLLCELDLVAPKGVIEPLRVYTPLAEIAMVTEAQRLYVATYARCLADYRACEFTRASEGWRALERDGPTVDAFYEGGPAAVMAERASEYAELPPEEPWDRSLVLTNK